MSDGLIGSIAADLAAQGREKDISLLNPQEAVMQFPGGEPKRGTTAHDQWQRARFRDNMNNGFQWAETSQANIDSQKLIDQYGDYVGQAQTILDAHPHMQSYPDLVHASITAGGDYMHNAAMIATGHLLQSVLDTVHAEHGSVLEQRLQHEIMRLTQGKSNDYDPTHNPVNYATNAANGPPGGAPTGPVLSGPGIPTVFNPVDQAKVDQTAIADGWKQSQNDAQVATLVSKYGYSPDKAQLIVDSQGQPQYEVPAPTYQEMLDMYRQYRALIVPPVLSEMYKNSVIPSGLLSTQQQEALAQLDKQFDPIFQQLDPNKNNHGNSQTNNLWNSITNAINTVLDPGGARSKLTNALNLHLDYGSQSFANLQAGFESLSSELQGNAPVAQPYPGVIMGANLGPFEGVVLSQLAEAPADMLMNTQMQFKMAYNAIMRGDYLKASEIIGVTAIEAVLLAKGGAIGRGIVARIAPLLGKEAVATATAAERGFIASEDIAGAQSVLETETAPTFSKPSGRSTIPVKYLSDENAIARILEQNDYFRWANGEHVGIRQYEREVVQEIANSVNRSMSEMWASGAYDNQAWAGLKAIKDDGLTKVFSGELNHGRIEKVALDALNGELANLEATGAIPPELINEVRFSAQTAVRQNVARFFDDGIARQGELFSKIARRSANVTRTLGLVSKHTVTPAARALAKVMSSRGYFAWSVAGGIGGPIQFRQDWENAKKTNLTIGQFLAGPNSWFGQHVFDSSGMIDTFVALTEGPMAFPGAAVSKAGATAFTEQTVEDAWKTSWRYRNALRQLSGKTPAQMIQLYPFLARDLGGGVTPAMLLTGIPMKDLKANAEQAYREAIDRGESRIAASTIRDDVYAGNTGLNAEEMHQVFLRLAGEQEYRTLLKLPQSGVYGMLRANKLSDNNVLQYFSKVLAQSPMNLTEHGAITATAINYGDVGGLPAIAQIMRQGGATSAQIRGTIDRLMADPGNHVLWGQVYKKALSNMMATSADRAAIKIIANRALKRTVTTATGETIEVTAKNTKELMDQFHEYTHNIDRINRRLGELQAIRDSGRAMSDQELYRFIDENAALRTEQVRVEALLRDVQSRIGGEDIRNRLTALYGMCDELAAKLAGDSYSGERGTYAISRGSGSRNVMVDMSQLANERYGALYFTQRGQMLIPSYKQIDREMIKLVEEFIGKDWKTLSYADITARNTLLKSGDVVNKVLNDLFFKPLALLTGGWATRVSISEDLLNTARLGFGEMTAGFAAQNLAKQAKQIEKHIERGMSAREAREKVLQEMEDAQFKIDTRAQREDALKRAQAQYDEFSQIGESQYVDPITGMTRTLKLGARPEWDFDSEQAKLLETLDPSRVDKILKDAGYTTTRQVGRGIASLVRGLIMGVDESVIRSVGREEYIRAAVELSFLHDSYLPASANAVHTQQVQMMTFGDYSGAAFTKGSKDKVKIYKTNIFGTKGAPRLKSVDVTRDFSPIDITNHGYFDGWWTNARMVADDKIFGSHAAGFLRDAYARGLEKREAREAAINDTYDFLRNMRPEVRESLQRAFHPEIKHAGVDPLMSWAATAIDDIERIVHGSGDIATTVFHKRLLDEMADGNLAHDVGSFIRDHARKVDPETGNIVMRDAVEMPNYVYGRVPRFTDVKSGLGAGLQRLASMSHEKVLGPIVNHMARQPTYIVEYVTARRKLEENVQAGMLSHDEASILAQIEAARNMIRFIHNPLDKTKIEQIVSLYSPFYFAENQAFRRVGRLFAQDPAAFFKYMTICRGITNYVQDVTDENGVSSTIIPLAATWLAGIPLTASFTNLAVMNPFSPHDLGGPPKSALMSFVDMVAPVPGFIPQVLGKYLLVSAPKHPFGEARQRRIAEDWLGYISVHTDWPRTFLPNSILRNLVDVKDIYIDGSSTRNARAMQAIGEAQNYIIGEISAKIWKQVTDEAKAQEKKTGIATDSVTLHLNFSNRLMQYMSTPGRWDTIRNEALHRGQHALIWKTIVGAISPLTVGIGQANQQMRTARDNYIKKFGYTEGMRQMWHDHPDWTIENTFGTKSVYGNYIPETLPMWEFATMNKNEVQRYPVASWAYGPDLSDKNSPFFSPSVQALVDAGIRVRQVPQDTFTNFMIAVGNSFYYNTAYELTDDQRALAKQELIKYNRPWANAQKPGNIGNSKLIYDQMMREFTDMWKNPKYTTGENAKITRNIMWFLGQLPNQNKNDSPYGMLEQLRMAQARGDMTHQQVYDTWMLQILPSVARAHPELKPALFSVFANL